MPRLPHSLILRAFKISPLLLLVLRGIRSLESATNELRWLREHVQESNVNSIRSSKKRLLQLCKRRSRGEPLQYILGSQPFGELDIKCRRGVLIPRPETEAYTTHLAELLIKETLHEQLVPNFVTKVQDSPDEKLFASPPELKILDICSGSGCISLLLYSLLSNHAKFRHLKIVGLDISEDAVSLAEENLQRNVANGRLSQSAIDRYDDWKTNLKGKHKNLKELKTNPAPQVQFLVSDIFLTEFPHCFGHFDIIISNPPYISREAFKTETTRSVRNWEPKLALVPSPKQTVELNYKLTNINEADVFYHQLLHIHTWNKSKVLVMEVGDAAQAARVVQMVLENPHAVGTNRIEIWRDWPDQDVQSGEVQSLRINGRQIPIKGAGKMRAVVLFRTGSFETTWEKK